ncbi:MAG: YARHG domain-containing protein [Candidatus Fermentibacteraceae bacterium]|nr:YARHG domain-containing protein [Candidatus Fermentibacteraceae bacterium]MBN2609152.1 YARHG domain-containing protein [Candidatus Fermentibacteraceae bacterium]
MCTPMRFILAVLLTVQVGRGFDADEIELFLRRSEVKADLQAGYRAVYEGEIDNLDFRLTDFQVAFLDGHELMLLRNTVFARLGYIFRNETLLDHFRQFQWYGPEYDDVSPMLSDDDLWNIRLVRYYEDRIDHTVPGLPDEEGMAGFWHGSAAVGSGYSDRFLLFEEGKFVYRGSSMDGSSRLEELSGMWSLDGGHLVLDADSASYLLGGDIIEPYASWGSEYVIENGVRTEVELVPHRVFRMPLDGYTNNYAECSGEEEYRHLTVPYVRIGFGGYWRISRDPAGMDY